MPASKAQQRATNKYMKANYDRVNLTLPKGRKAELQAHAERRGESLNGFIGRAIDETITEYDNERKKMMETYQAFETHLSAILKILDAQGISMDDFLVKVSLDKQGNVAEFSIDLNDGAFSKMTDGAWRELEKLKGK